MAELLEGSELDETQKHYLRVIQRSGNTLMVVINDILDYSKIEVGQMRLLNSPLELNDLIEETTVPYRLIPDSNVQFDVHLDTNIPVHLKGDAVRLHQVLSNLLNNAFKFTHAGSIILSASLVKLNNTDAEIKFSVSDSGEGIDESTLKIIFDPFTQADQSTARKHGGTGLGLSICKRLIELMGGELSVDSTLGKGSVFYFCVRLSLNESPITISDKKTNPEDYSNLRVLLVEDNLVNQMVLKGYLEKLGIQSCVVSDGEAATDIICEHRRPFDLILMDCEMPGIDGYQATKNIRQWELATNQPAITICALTAHVLPEHISKCKESGMDNHLAKPLKLNDLTEYLRTLDSFKI
jgi:CheY-like chemotaxis protein